jgi:hypothetical protein
MPADFIVEHDYDPDVRYDYDYGLLDAGVVTATSSFAGSGTVNATATIIVSEAIEWTPVVGAVGLEQPAAGNAGLEQPATGEADLEEPAASEADLEEPATGDTDINEDK